MALTKIPGGLIEAGAITAASLNDDAVTTDKILDANITHAKLHTSMDLTGKTVTVATAAGSTNSTAAASTAFVQQELTTLIGGAPSTLNDLNELAAAINDDANYNSTLTTALATKLPLAGGTMTGAVVLGTTSAQGNQTSPALRFGTSSYRLGMYTTSEGAFIENKNGDDGINFLVKTAGQAMRIDGGTGDVLVGSSTNLNVLSGTPKLQIGSGTGHSSLQFYSGASSVAGLYFGDADSDGARYSGYIEYRHNTNSMAFRTNDAERMSIDSLGNVGIGVAANTARLKVEQSVSSEWAMNIKHASTGVNYGLSIETSAGATNDVGALQVYPPSGGGLIFTNRSKLGIGTTAPNSMLEISFGDNASTQRWSYGAAKPNFYLELDTFIPSGGVVAYSFDMKNNSTAYNNNLVLDRGKVGIGTASPGGSSSTKLHLMSTTTSSPTVANDADEFIIEGAGNSGMTFLSTSSSNIRFGDAADSSVGIISYSHSANSLTFGTNNSTAMTIDSSGNVGIGHTAPTSKLHVAGAKGYVSGTLTNMLQVEDTTAAATGVGGGIQFMGAYSGTTVTTGGSIEASKSNGSGGNYSFDMIFKTRDNGGNNLERARLGSDGGDPSYGRLRLTSSWGSFQIGAGNTGYHHFTRNSGPATFYFSNRCEASGGFHTYSDERLKENIVAIPSALDKVALMNGVTFKWKDAENRGSGDTGKQFGVIAQNMLEVDSELPSLNVDPLAEAGNEETDEKYYTMDYTRITPFLIESIKELKTKLEAAEARIATLEG